MDEKIIEETVETVDEVTKKGIGTRTKVGVGLVAAGLIAGAAYKLYKKFSSSDDDYEVIDDDDWDELDEFFEEDDETEEEK